MHILEQLKNWYEHFGGIKELVRTFCIYKGLGMHIFWMNERHDMQILH